ncbi:hypothetical protein D5086_005283 [Populus alba]|uniref:Uncharacterized protein n=1 Tax=Populus alba TaxID=43335 RepID=A0ACC4CUW6_POPAL
MRPSASLQLQVVQFPDLKNIDWKKQRERKLVSIVSSKIKPPDISILLSEVQPQTKWMILERQFLATAWIEQGRAGHRVRTRISGLAGKPQGRADNLFSSG